MLVGPEIIAGSTRLNAGTAQKVVLNIISTAAMVQLGKTYGGLMVDLRATNAKLRDRATRIVAEIAGVPLERAREALERSEWKPKIAAAMLVGGIDPETAAETLLERNRGRLRPALEELESACPSSLESRPSPARASVSASLPRSSKGCSSAGTSRSSATASTAVGLSGRRRRHSRSRASSTPR